MITPRSPSPRTSSSFESTRSVRPWSTPPTCIATRSLPLAASLWSCGSRKSRQAFRRLARQEESSSEAVVPPGGPPTSASPAPLLRPRATQIIASEPATMLLAMLACGEVLSSVPRHLPHRQSLRGSYRLVRHVFGKRSRLPRRPLRGAQLSRASSGSPSSSIGPMPVSWTRSGFGYWAPAHGVTRRERGLASETPRVALACSRTGSRARALLVRRPRFGETKALEFPVVWTDATSGAEKRPCTASMNDMDFEECGQSGLPLSLLAHQGGCDDVSAWLKSAEYTGGGGRWCQIRSWEYLRMVQQI